MNLHVWEFIVGGVLISLPFFSRSARTILFETFRHPTTTSTIIRDDKTGEVHAEREDHTRAHA